MLARFADAYTSCYTMNLQFTRVKMAFNLVLIHGPFIWLRSVEDMMPQVQLESFWLASFHGQQSRLAAKSKNQKSKPSLIGLSQSPTPTPAPTPASTFGLCSGLSHFPNAFLYLLNGKAPQGCNLLRHRMFWPKLD